MSQITSTNYRNPYPENLFISGGGPKDIAFIGCIEELESNKTFDNLKRIGGSSAGAIIACLLAVGYTANELALLVLNKSLLNLLNPINGERLLYRVKSVCSLGEMVKKLGRFFFHPVRETRIRLSGVFTFNSLQHWLDKLIEDKTGIKNCTFGELRELAQKRPLEFKHVYVYTTTTDKQPYLINSEKNEENERDHIIISDAVRASAAFPLRIVKAQHLHHKINGKSERMPDGKLHMDGGVLNNFDMDLFRKVRGANPHRTLGLCFTPESGGFLNSVNAAIDQQVINARADSEKSSRIIQVDPKGVSTLNPFTWPCNNKKRKMMKSGKNAAEVYCIQQKWKSSQREPLYESHDHYEGGHSYGDHIRLSLDRFFSN